MDNKQEDWTLVIKPKDKWYIINLKEIWRYRDLLLLFVRRDFVQVYKQTVLGPLWFFVQPVLTTIIFTFVFGNLAGLAPEGVPTALFYMAGITAWNYFSDCLVKTSSTFTANANIFGKVYFPRLIVPLSLVMSNLFKFGVQFLLLLGVYIYYVVQGEVALNLKAFLLIPLLLALMALMGLAFGLLISSITTKYRDFKFLVDFGVRLMMYLSPVVFPLALIGENVASGKLHPLFETGIMANPMTGVIEAMKYVFMGSEGGVLDWALLAYTAIFTFVLLFISLLSFGRIEKSFMDTV